MRERKAKDLITDLAFDFLGTGLYALGTQMFNAPNNIAPGGATGIAILINYVTGVPIWLLSFLINIPLLLLGFLFLGRRFTARTLKSVVVLSITLQLAERFAPIYRGETILIALAGGVMLGVGMSMIFMRSSTTGGTDILARLIQKRYPDMAVGRLLLLIDAAVLISAAVVYQNVESALFALVSMYTRSAVMDTILYGMEAGKVMMIICEKPQEMAQAIIDNIGRGCTLLDGQGAYTMQKRVVLLCAVRKPQYFELKKLVNSRDPDAFMIAMEANEVIGYGFKDFGDSVT